MVSINFFFLTRKRMRNAFFLKENVCILLLGTDDGDLKFNYLSSFGPRFRKLADMYGEDPSDEDSHDGGEESWC